MGRDNLGPVVIKVLEACIAGDVATARSLAKIDPRSLMQQGINEAGIRWSVFPDGDERRRDCCWSLGADLGLSRAESDAVADSLSDPPPRPARPAPGKGKLGTLFPEGIIR